MSEFLAALLKGMAETPRGFFAPIVAVWRLLVQVTDSLVEMRHRA